MEISELKSQAGLYKHLSMLFYPPDKSELTGSSVFDSLIHFAKQMDSKLLLEVSRLPKNFDSYSEQELNIEFSKLFLGPFGLIAAPYGSVYLDDQFQVNGPSTVMVNRIYMNHDLQLELSELPDHIAIELEFIALLLEEGQTFEKGSELELFHSNYFEPWISPFCEKIINGTDNGYFSCLARVLVGVTKSCSINIPI